ncbi:MAG: hypothetical protein A2Z91_02495 [Deltaproteobacteria bacterium GWA2_38_16]|nr:MAG: hypothetical protein A2Z91_02495 [Deltaproteobacteria bacterium GWA2_38_16]OGQ02063.1 MAG: hypothetical protein A3D19_08790 [Deltaproteobacteria bacterium RIFCSPHIGHO2_02_FULL_38_15]OGQ32551.1 MAG: hypothetical protein A3A72_03150 [Deltaproteobacteria bacterium RIFCSPLOWO2_01_FULL_38_9]OGQ64230.1 MAG: hypothetical protein A3G92_06470 [Deltaproteobacteria bacterium RIFCSPLOWO2_12_FULL_38_8]HBQ21600.1 hypothetical protein [Deltaproteobacteria bacterium]
MSTQPTIIKRYQNRKLYNTEKSCYVTLDDLAEMIRRGEEIVVLDNRTKKDITSNTLTQIIFETEKKSKSLLPIHILIDIIKGNGGSISTFFQKTIKTGVKEFTQVKDEIQRRIEDVTGKVHLHKEIAQLRKKVSDLQKKLSEYEENSKN